jgi:hypothetical protein
MWIRSFDGNGQQFDMASDLVKENSTLKEDDLYHVVIHDVFCNFISRVDSIGTGTIIRRRRKLRKLFTLMMGTSPSEKDIRWVVQRIPGLSGYGS